MWSVLLFGGEAWTISKEMRKRLEAAGMVRLGYGGGKKSKRKTEDEMHGWNRRTDRMCKDG